MMKPAPFRILVAEHSGLFAWVVPQPLTRSTFRNFGTEKTEAAAYQAAEQYAGLAYGKESP